MFNQRRIDPLELDRLLAEGKSQSECARLLNVSKQAVSKALQRKHSGGLPVKAPPHKYSKDSLGPYKNLMSTTLGEIRYLNNAIKAAKDETRSSLNLERLKYIAESRKQFELAIELDEKRFAIEEVLKFRNYVIEKIGEVDEQTRDEIISNLQRGHTLRKLLTRT